MSMNLYISGYLVAAPTEITINNEIIWSSDTGRTMSGYMMGELIANKNTVSIKWEFLTQAEVNTLENAINKSAYEYADAYIDDTKLFGLTAYRSTLAKDLLGKRGSTIYYRSVTVDLIER